MTEKAKSSKTKLKSFTDLECWKACRVVRNRFSGIIRKLPMEEKYALADAMRRASRSITENIAEGFGRYHFQENIQFCRISRGSLFELKDQLITAFDEKYIDKQEAQQVNILINNALSLLNGYINYLAKAKVNYNPKNKNIVQEPFESYISDDSKLLDEANDFPDPPIT